MSEGEQRTQILWESVHDALDEFTEILMGMLLIILLPEEPQEQIRRLTDLLRDLPRNIDEITYYIVATEEIEYRFNEMWTVYREVLNDIQSLSELENLSDENISAFRQAGLVMLQALTDLFPGVIELLDISEESATILHQFNTALRRRLGTDVPQEEEIQNSEAVRTRDASDEFDIEKSTVWYIYKKIQKTTTEEEFKDNCTVCMCDLEDEDKARRFPCLHVYHKQCADEWLRVNWRCPVCRFDIREEPDDFPRDVEGCAAE